MAKTHRMWKVAKPRQALNLIVQHLTELKKQSGYLLPSLATVRIRIPSVDVADPQSEASAPPYPPYVYQYVAGYVGRRGPVGVVG